MVSTLALVLALSGSIQAEPYPIREFLVLDPVGSGGRVPIVTNAVTEMLVSGTFVAPKEGDAFPWSGGARTWTRATADEGGTVSNRAFRGGFAFANVTMESEQVMMLDASGHSYVYLNGEPRGGDPYGYGVVRHPVLLRKGDNSLLFSVGRGSLRASLVPTQETVFLEARDATLPDLIVGEQGDHWGSVMVTNATRRVWKDMVVTAVLDGADPVTMSIAELPPLTSQRVPFMFRSPQYEQPGPVRLTLRIQPRVEGQAFLATMGFDLTVKELHDLHKRTFVSETDGSVQYYAVRPPLKEHVRTARALVLSVHGAGVEATGQAAAYGAKSWAWLVAPTNRRPFGFDWEDWGRIDAMEALADAKRRYRPAEDQIYLTGHSMGGHGTWFLGATYPDQWAAIGPAAGWISFWTYGGAVRFENPDPLEALLLRAANPSDTTKLLRNYLHHGVFVLHGDADQTVPVSQARQMRETLALFHRDVDWHEEPGGGHWYDTTPEPGADCVDYGPMFEFFGRHRRRLSHEVRRVEFHTTSPQVSSTSHWITIAQQVTPLSPSSVVATNPVGTRQFILETVNVQVVGIHVDRSPVTDTESMVSLSINGIALPEMAATEGTIWAEKTPEGWKIRSQPGAAEKSPMNGGPFRSAFTNRFLLVYGTTGSEEENAWSYAKARFDAETWGYRANGYAEIVPDTAFTVQGARRRGTNMVVYGNEDTNSVARALLQDSDVRVTRNFVSIDGRKLEGDDLSILLVKPKSLPGATVATQFAIVGGTGMRGLRSTETMPYFVSGVHYPDVFVYDSRIHSIGSKAVRVTGFFGNDWSVANGEFAWRDQ